MNKKRNSLPKFKKEADGLGYTLIKLDIQEFEDSDQLILQLRTQEIAGLMLELVPSFSLNLHPLLANFATVSIGLANYYPACPIVLHDEFLAITRTWLRLEQRGYKRIGPILANHPNSVALDFRTGAIFSRQRYIKETQDRIPILFLDPEKPESQQDMEVWLQTYSPDVVLGYRPISQELSTSEYKLPGNLPFAAFNLWDPNLRGKIAGYFRENLTLFKRGIHLLDTMIQSGTAGTQHAGLIEMVDGEWVDGKSLPL